MSYRPLLLLIAALGLPGGAARAQAADDLCPLAVRASHARPEASCLELRTLPLPAIPTRAVPARVEPLPLRVGGALRTGYPVDRNNGALWTGRGAAAALTAGIAVHMGRLTLTAEPELVWSQNRAFRVPARTSADLSRFAYPWGHRSLDWFTRSGGGSRLEVAPGGSHVEVRLGKLRAGVSTERIWWGAARRYPLLFSGSAPGFPHAYVETPGWLESPVGGFGAHLLWGRLEESRWFDADPRNDLRLLGAFQLRWRVDFVPGLELSYAVARHEPLPGRTVAAGQFLQLFTGDPAGEAADRRGTPLGTLGLRLAVPEAGVEVYAEVGRGDGFLNGEPGVSDTRLAQVYVLGFARTGAPGTGDQARWRFSAEVIRQSLELPQPAVEESPASVPVRARQGHTHRGQLLGAYIGPGSNAQYVALDRLAPARTWGFFAERVRRDDDTYFREHASAYGFRGHDVEWTLGARAGGWLDVPALERVTGPLAFGVTAGVSRRKNRNFTDLDGGANWSFLREWNGWADLYLVWDLRLRRGPT